MRRGSCTPSACGGATGGPEARRMSAGDVGGFAPPTTSLAHFRSAVQRQVHRQTHDQARPAAPRGSREPRGAQDAIESTRHVGIAAEAVDASETHRQRARPRDVVPLAAVSGVPGDAGTSVSIEPSAPKVKRTNTNKSIGFDVSEHAALNLVRKRKDLEALHSLHGASSRSILRNGQSTNRTATPGDITDRSACTHTRPSRNSGASAISESVSHAAPGMRQPQYTLDTLRDVIQSSGGGGGGGAGGVACSTANGGGISTGDASDAVGVMPDRDQLRDQLEWDIGVHETLALVKQEQIREQIAMDARHEAQNARVRKQSLGVQRARHPNRDRDSVRRSTGSIISDGLERTTHVLNALLRRASHCDTGALTSAQAAANHKRRMSTATCGPEAAHPHDGRPRSASVDKGVGAATELAHGKASKLARMCGDDAAGMSAGGRQSLGSGGKQHMNAEAHFALGIKGRSRSRRSLFEGLANTADMSRARRYIISPNGYGARAWEVATLLVIFVISVVEPVRVSHIFDDVDSLRPVSLYVDLHMLVDMLLHFVTAYDDDLRDIQVTSPSYIVDRYARSWLSVDLLCAFPFDHMARLAVGAYTEAVISVRMIKIVASHRLISGRSQRAALPGSTPLNPSLVTLWKLMLIVVFVWHWTACLFWALVRRSRSPRVFDADDEWSPPPMVFHSNESVVRYAYAINWAIGITTQTNFPAPSTLDQLVFGAAATVLGLLMMSLIIGSATTALSDLQAQRSEVSMRLQHIDRYMRYKRLPKQIRRRIVSFYRFQYTSMNRVDESDVLIGLPRALRMQMSLVMHKPIFVQLPLFWLCSEEEILLITQRLRPCVIMPGEMIIKEDRLGVGLFLLMKGAVESLRSGDLVVVLLAVAAFGENALRNTVSNVSIRALRFCETTVLLREDFAIVEQLNPSVRRWLDIYILERDRKLADPHTRRASQLAKVAAMRAARSQQWCTSSRSMGGARTPRAHIGRVAASISNVLAARRLRRAMKAHATRRRLSIEDVVTAKRSAYRAGGAMAAVRKRLSQQARLCGFGHGANDHATPTTPTTSTTSPSLAGATTVDDARSREDAHPRPPMRANASDNALPCAPGSDPASASVPQTHRTAVRVRAPSVKATHAACARGGGVGDLERAPAPSQGSSTVPTLSSSTESTLDEASEGRAAAGNRMGDDEDARVGFLPGVTAASREATRRVGASQPAAATTPSAAATKRAVRTNATHRKGLATERKLPPPVREFDRTRSDLNDPPSMAMTRDADSARNRRSSTCAMVDFTGLEEALCPRNMRASFLQVDPRSHDAVIANFASLGGSGGSDQQRSLQA